MRGTGRWARAGAVAGALLCGLPLGGCALLPDELNLSPLYRHRRDRDGTLLELDVLWPIVHYERRSDGGGDFRIRPFYRRISEREPEPAVEYQFLWPLGRWRTKGDDESLSRVFPFFYKQVRRNAQGVLETDWYFLFPFVWGGHREDGKEDYLAVLPFYADMPEFLTYDRVQTHLFPLHVRLEKNEQTRHIWLWPLIGWGGNEAGDRRWHRALPLYSVAIDEERYRRYSVLWPFVHWGVENIDRSPYSTFFLWPLYGQQSGETVDSWTFLWPFFSKTEVKGRYYKLDVLWPIFRTVEDRSEISPLRQWWLFPFVARTTTNDQRSQVYLWPLVWIREYDDPGGTMSQEWVIPFAWHSRRILSDGTDDDFLKIWPLFHRHYDHEGQSEVQLFSPLPWRHSNLEGVDETYGWLWTLAKARTHAAGDTSFELTANLATARTRGGRTTVSVPFLFNFEEDEKGSTLRLLQFLPIRWGKRAADAAANEERR